MARRLTGWIPQRQTDGKLEYTSAETARAEAGFEEMEEYIHQSQNTFTQYIATRSLLNLYEVMERTQGPRVGMWWWDQAGINLVGARYMVAVAVAVAAVEADEDGLE